MRKKGLGAACAALILALLLALAGCGGGQTDTAGTADATKPQTDVSGQYGSVLAATAWEQTGTGETYVFTENGRFTCGAESGRWWLLSDGSLLTLVLDGTQEREFAIAVFTNSLLEMSDADGNEIEWTAVKDQENTAPQPAEPDPVGEGLTRWESDSGYVLDYDAASFNASDADSTDTFRAIYAADTYLSVQLHTDMSAAAIAGGVEMQSRYATDTGTGCGGDGQRRLPAGGEPRHQLRGRHCRGLPGHAGELHRH